MKFEDMEVWQRAVELSCSIYKCCKDNRDYGYRDQITRAGLSVPSNIAEGLERSSIKESLNFLSYAKASCGEVYTQLVIGQKIGYLCENVSVELKAECKVIAKMIGALMKARNNF